MRDEEKTKEQLLSELQQVRDQLAKSEQLLQQPKQRNTDYSINLNWETSFLTTLLDAVIIFDENQNIIFFNKSAEKIFGYEANEVMGKPLDMLLPPRFVERHRQHIRDFTPILNVTRYMDLRSEIAGQHKDGNEFPARATVSKLYRDGKTQFIAVLRDISERKRIEDELRRYRNRLETLVEERTSELQKEIAERIQAEATLQKLSQAVIQSPTSVMITNAEGEIEYVNPAFTYTTGYLSEEVIGRNPRILNSNTHPLEYYQVLWKTILSGKTWQADICNRKKNGDLYWELQSISPIKNLQGDITHFVAVKVDQTEHRLADKQRLQLALEKEKVELLRNFIGDVSHDLKTPLSIFKTHLYLLEKAPLPEQYRRRVQVLIETAQHLEKLIEDLLTLSSLDGGSHLTIVTLNLHTMIFNIDAKFRSLARQKNILVVLELDTSPPIISADESEIYRALINLMDNALKYTPEGGTITISTQKHDTVTIIEISDTGQGIEENDLPHIFDRFYRADKARSSQSGGAGLGLAIVKKVIEMHAGRVEVESTIGTGSVFRVYLPVVQVEYVS